MTATGQIRGHKVQYADGGWVYSDNGEPVDDTRPCVSCGEYPTAEGFDPCMGEVDGAVSVCCGHGVEAPYVVFGGRR